MSSLNDRVTEEKHRIIVSLIPEIDCPSDCHLCCDHPLSMFYDSYGHKGVVFFEDCRCVCESFTGQGCRVYDNRPFVCRIFWKDESNPICHGGKSAKRILTKEEFGRLLWCWIEGTLQDAFALKAWMGVNNG